MSRSTKLNRSCKKVEKPVVVETHTKQKIPVHFTHLRTAHGYCFNPAGPDPKILIESRLLPRRKLNVLIEEVAHAFWYDAPEYKVRKFSAQLGKLIHQLFLRK